MQKLPILAALAAILPAALVAPPADPAPTADPGPGIPLPPGPAAPQVLQVSGRGTIEIAPDRAFLRLGAFAQAETAATAQESVNAAVARIIEKLKALGIPPEKIRTAAISLGPVLEQRQPPGGPPAEPKVVAYRASNSIGVTVEDLKRVGDLIDAALAAGANRLESLTFDLRDDSQARREALRRAVVEARGKAEAIAGAMDLAVGPVLEVIEAGIEVPRPAATVGFSRAAEVAAGSPAPVEPGEVRVEASVTVRYGLGTIRSR